MRGRAGQARAKRRMRRKRKWAQRGLMPTSVNALAALLRSRNQALTAERASDVLAMCGSTRTWRQKLRVATQASQIKQSGPAAKRTSGWPRRQKEQAFGRHQIAPADHRILSDVPQLPTAGKSKMPSHISNHCAREPCWDTARRAQWVWNHYCARHAETYGVSFRPDVDPGWDT